MSAAFNLRSTLGQSLDRGDDLVGLGGTDDDLDLDGAAVNEKTVKLLEGSASAIRLVENHVGDTTALRVGAVRELDALDGTDRLNKVFLCGAVAVS